MPSLLIVDDAPFIREIVVAIVEPAGFHVVGEARDGQEAIDLAVTLRPDVILMDIVMPKKSGIEATREILQKFPEAKIVAFSTADQDILAARMLEAGARSFLAKPFRSNELLKALNECLLNKTGG